jgi:hypothetical protein
MFRDMDTLTSIKEQEYTGQTQRDQEYIHTKETRHDIHILPITIESMDDFKELNEAVFPVLYNPSFYSNVLNIHSNYSRIVLYQQCLAGAISCRKEPMNNCTSFRCI